MLTDLGVLKPDVPRAGYVESQLLKQWAEQLRQISEWQWQQYFALRREIPIFHDPLWRGRLMSFQCVNDVYRWKIDLTNPAHWFWMMIAVLGFVAGKHLMFWTFVQTLVTVVP